MALLRRLASLVRGCSAVLPSKTRWLTSFASTSSVAPPLEAAGVPATDARRRAARVRPGGAVEEAAARRAAFAGSTIRQRLRARHALPQPGFAVGQFRWRSASAPTSWSSPCRRVMLAPLPSPAPGVVFVQGKGSSVSHSFPAYRDLRDRADPASRGSSAPHLADGRRRRRRQQPGVATSTGLTSACAASIRPSGACSIGTIGSRAAAVRRVKLCAGTRFAGDQSSADVEDQSAALRSGRHFEEFRAPSATRRLWCVMMQAQIGIGVPGSRAARQEHVGVCRLKASVRAAPSPA